MTVNVWPPTVNVPLRGLVLVLAEIEKPTVPLPVPVPPVTVIQDPALLTVLQAQPVVVVTVTLPEPPAAASVWLAGEIEKAQAPF